MWMIVMMMVAAETIKQSKEEGEEQKNRRHFSEQWPRKCKIGRNKAIVIDVARTIEFHSFSSHPSFISQSKQQLKTKLDVR